MTKCPACFKEEIAFFEQIVDLKQQVFKLSKCHSCGTVFLNPPPSEKELIEAYDQSYYGHGESKFHPWIEETISGFRQQEAKKVAATLHKNASILDVGCGNGGFLSQLGKYGQFKLFGIEPEGKSAQRAAEKSEINLAVEYFGLENFPGQKFDLIRFMHVFEHIPNPNLILKYCFQNCKDQGQLIIEIPNIESWQAQWFRSKWFHFDPPRHLHLIPVKELIEMLEKEGFMVLSKKSYSFQFGPFGYQQSLLNLFVTKRDLLYEQLKKNKTYYRDYHSILLWFQLIFHWVSFPFFWLIEILSSLFNKGSIIRLVCKRK